MIQDEFTTGRENYKEFFYALVGLAGEGQNFDGNGMYVRFQTGGGSTRSRSARSNLGSPPQFGALPIAAARQPARATPAGAALQARRALLQASSGPTSTARRRRCPPGARRTAATAGAREPRRSCDRRSARGGAP